MRFVVGGTGAIPFGSEPAPGRRMVSHSLRCRVTITPDPPQRSATMTEPLIWTRDDILRFTHEPDSYDRAWAWDWLKRHHGAEASRQAARAILDPDPGLACTGRQEIHRSRGRFRHGWKLEVMVGRRSER